MRKQISKNTSRLMILIALSLLTIGTGIQWAQAPALDYAPDEVLVQFLKDTPASARSAALQAAAARAIEFLGAPEDVWAGRPGVYRTRTTIPVPVAIGILSQHPAVAFAEPNWKVYHQDVATDPYYTAGSLWGMYGDDNPPAGSNGTTNAYGSDAEEAWYYGRTGSNTVYVGVIDTGIQFAHPDLAANIWINSYDPVDGIDNDGNGFVDDIYGWDFYYNDNSVYDGTADSHGTHVAGTIGAKGNNGIGVAGMNWNVTIIPAKFLGPPGGYTSDAVRALNYLRDLKTRHGFNLVATNNSWGGGGYSQSLHDAIIRAAKAGMLFVAAAGNGGSDSIGDNNDLLPSYPSSYSTLTGTSTVSAASYEAVIAVAAINSSGGLASFSNYGAASVDLGAPGVGINSTLPVDSYGSYSGTSMATPHVTGAAALYASVNAGATAEQIRSAILGNAVATASLAGKTVTGGRLNVGGNFFSSAPPPPPATVHDVAVTAISAPSSARRGQTVNVSVTVMNQGNFAETFDVILTVAPSQGTINPAKWRVTSLSPGASSTASFTWNTPGGAAKGSYTLTATASQVPGETDTADNSRSTKTNLR